MSKFEGLLPNPVSQVDPSPGVPPPSVSQEATTGSSRLMEASNVMNTAAVVEPRASVTHFPVPSFITFPTPDPFTSGDTTLSDAMTQFVTADIKARNLTRKSSKKSWQL